MKLLFTITAFLTCLVLHFGLCRALALELDLKNDVQQTEISVDYGADSTTTTTTTTTTITIDINSTTSDQSISSQPSFSSSSSSSSSPNELDSDDYDFEDEESSSSSSSSATDNYLQALSSALRNRLNSSTTYVELDMEEDLEDLKDLDLDDVDKDEEENAVQDSEQEGDEQKFEQEEIVVDAEADQAVPNSTGSVEASAANNNSSTQVDNSSQPIASISNSTDQTLLHQATANSAEVHNSTTASTLSAISNNNNNNDTSSSSNNTDKLPTEHTGNSEAPPVQQQPIENQSSNSNNENNNSPLYGGLPKETFEWLEKYARPGSAGARIESYQEFQKAFYEKVGMADDRKDEVEGEDESDRRFRLAVALHHSPDTTTTTTPPLPQPSFPSSSFLSVDQGRQHRPELLIKTGSNGSNDAISSQLAVRRIIVRRSSEDEDHPENPLNSSTIIPLNSTELLSPFSPPPLKTASPFNASTAEPRAPSHRGLFTPSKPFLLGLSLGGGGGSGTGSGSTAEQEKNSPPLLEALLQTIQSTLPSIKLSSPNSLSLPGRLAATLQKLKTALVEKKKLGPLIEYFNRLTEGVGSSLMSGLGGKFSPSKRRQQQQRPQHQKLSQQRPPPQTQQPQPQPQQPKPRPARPSPPSKQTPVLPPPKQTPVQQSPLFPFPSTLSLFPQLRAQSPPSKRCTTDGECLPATTPFFATVLGHCDQALGRCVRGPRQLCGPFTLCRPVNGLKTFCANAHCNVLV